MSDYTYEWCNKELDDNDFFCIWNAFKVKEDYLLTYELIDRTDLSVYIFPFTHWHWTVDYHWEYQAAWEYEWKLTRYMDQIMRFNIPEFSIGSQIDVVFHFNVENLAVCVHPGMYVTPFNWKIEQEVSLL